MGVAIFGGADACAHAECASKASTAKAFFMVSSPVYRDLPGKGRRAIVTTHVIAESPAYSPSTGSYPALH